MATGPTNKVKYKGYEIALTDNFLFRVTGPLIPADDDETVQSVNLAKALIEQYLRSAAKQKKAELRVITDKGRPFTIVGINRHTCRMITRPEVKRDDDDEAGFYPDVDAIKPLLAKWKKLKAELAAVERTVEKFKIDKSRGWRIDAENYPGEIDRLIKEYSDKKTAAELYGQPKPPKKPPQNEQNPALAPRAEDN